MAVVERTIIAGGGGDYTTIAAWETATNLNAGADIWKGVISDNSAYNETVTINAGGTGTSSYIWLTVASGNRHAGVWNTGKARIAYTGAATAAIEITSDFVRVDWLQITRSGASFGSSDEGIRFTSNSCLFSYLVMWAQSSVDDTDGIYCNSTATGSVDNCVIYGWGRSAVHIQSAGTHTVNVDHCTLVLNGQNAGSSFRSNILSSNNTTSTFNVYNTCAVSSPGTKEIVADSGDTATITGSHNALTANNSTYISGWDTNTTTNWIAATGGLVDTAPGSAAAYITETDLATFNGTPVAHANNVLMAAGTDRSSSEPDSRQDFSVAINGARGTTSIDIGAFQVTGAGGGTKALPIKRNPIRSLIVR